MDDFLALAQKYYEQTVKHRRHLHLNPEIEDKCEKTAAYIGDFLHSLGIEYRVYENNSVVVELGEGERCVLVRADIDALPVAEISGLEYAATNGYCHCCGHDFHTSSALTAIKILSQMKLNGRIRFVFQSDEERIKGAKYLIDNGVADGVDVAVGMHVAAGLRAGAFNVMDGGYLASSDIFEIVVNGRAAHGSMPENGIDPLLIGAKIVLDAQTITSRIIDALEPVVVTFGSFNAGSTHNIIPDKARLTGTIRAFSDQSRSVAVQKLKEISQSIAALYGATADFTILSNTPVTYNNPELTASVASAARELLGDDNVFAISLELKASDDFAYYSQRVPSVMYHIGIGDAEQGCHYPLHNPKIVMCESALLNASAFCAYLPFRLLEKLTEGE